MIPASRLQIIAAFAVVYTVWGSTYLGIRIGVADIPPALLIGIRNLIAGAALIAVARARGQRLPRATNEWRSAIIIGCLMIGGGNGLIAWGEQWVASNQAALIATTSALWIAWFGTFGAKGQTLTPRVTLGLIIGFVGAALMLAPGQHFTFAHLSAQLTIMFSAVCWAGGAMYGRSLTLATPPLMFAAIQMVVGGAVLMIVGLSSGEAAHWQWSSAGIGALAYLTVFGSCLAYTTYIWLIRHTTPDKLSTIAYVNPVIALVLGWWVLDEQLTGIRLSGMAVILVGVILVTARKPRRRPVQRRG